MRSAISPRFAISSLISWKLLPVAGSDPRLEAPSGEQVALGILYCFYRDACFLD